MTTSTLTNNSTTSASTQTYLQKCIEDLEPSNISSWNRKSTQWQVAAIATYVAFTVLTIGGLAAATAFAPVYIPIVAVSSFFLLKSVKVGHDLLESWSVQASARAQQLKEISKHLQELSSATPQQLQQILQQKGIQWFMIPGMQNPNNLTQLNPLIARHNFWERYVQNLEEKKREKLDEATRLSSESYADNKNEIYDLRCEALEIEKRALEGKLKNAFIHAIIRRPAYTGTLEDLGTITLISGQERGIGNAASAASINDFFTFKNGRTPTISVDEIKRMTISDLAMRLIAAIGT
jgi:hypothetical protein